MKNLTQLIDDSNLFEKDNESSVLYIVHINGQYLGYSDIPVNYWKVQELIKDLVKTELEKLLVEIRKLDDNRPDFKKSTIPISGKLNYGELVKNLSKEDVAARDKIKELVTSHNKTIKHTKIEYKNDEAIDYFVSILNKIDIKIQEQFSDGYLSFIKLENCEFSSIFKNRDGKRNFVVGRINSLLNTKNIANLCHIIHPSTWSNYHWEIFCKNITIVPIKKFVCKKDIADTDHQNERHYLLPDMEVESDEDEDYEDEDEDYEDGV